MSSKNFFMGLLTVLLAQSKTIMTLGLMTPGNLITVLLVVLRPLSPSPRDTIDRRLAGSSSSTPLSALASLSPFRAIHDEISSQALCRPAK